MAKKEAYRDLEKQGNKILGAYLMIWAWTHKVDCVAIGSKALLSLLNFSKAYEVRKIINWMKKDLEKIFPHTFTVYRTSQGIYGTLYLSRFPYPKGFPWDCKNAKKTISRLKKEGLNTQEAKVPSRAEMISSLVKLIHGIEDL